MRVVPSGNLTVELIRAQRFDVACQNHVAQLDQQCHPCNAHAQHDRQQQIDRVELSPQALASDPRAVDAKRADAALKPVDNSNLTTVPNELPAEPERLSPVVGSQALAGLGAAWVVPGTLLDVVA